VGDWEEGTWAVIYLDKNLVYNIMENNQLV